MRKYFRLFTIIFSYLLISPIFGQSSIATTSTGTSTPSNSAGLSADLNNAIDEIDDVFEKVISPWTTQAKIMAKRIFFMLLGLDFAWMIILFLLKGDAIDGLMGQVAMKVLLYGLAWFLVLNGDGYLRDIFDFFIKGSEGAGNSEINVGNFFDDSIAVIIQLSQSLWGDLSSHGLDTASGWGMNALVAFLKLGLILGMAFLIAYVCATIMVAYVEMYMTITATIVLFGFFVSDWTRDITQRSILHTIAMSFKLFTTLLIGRICLTMVKRWIDVSVSGSFVDLLTMAAAMFVLAMLLAKLPRVMGAIVSITSVFSPGDAIANALRGIGMRGAVKEPAAAVGVGVNAYRLARQAGASGFVQTASATAKGFASAYGTAFGSRFTAGRTRELRERSSIGGQASAAIQQARNDLDRDRV